jgi:hypothetical protein
VSPILKSSLEIRKKNILEKQKGKVKQFAFSSEILSEVLNNSASICFFG